MNLINEQFEQDEIVAYCGYRRQRIYADRSKWTKLLKKEYLIRQNWFQFESKKRLLYPRCRLSVQNSTDTQNAFEQRIIVRTANIICRCERVKKSEIIELINAGYTGSK